MYTDNLDAKSVLSKRENRYAQIFITSLGWYEAPSAFYTLFAQDSTPNAMSIVDGAKEQTLGDSQKKCHKASYHAKQIMEPFLSCG